MSAQAAHQSMAKNGRSPPAANKASGLLQRKCSSCGDHTVAGGECSECGKRKRRDLQTKLAVNEPGDIYEQEADRIAAQVLAGPVRPDVGNTPPRIQRFIGQPAGETETVPSSAGRVLASPGRQLEPALRQDMEQRFGHDFSGVRVHTGGLAVQSAQELNANAYTVGNNIVFGAGQFASTTLIGRQVIAHELTHVVQQSKLYGGNSHTDDQRWPLQRQETRSSEITGPETSGGDSERWNITFSLTRRSYENATREEAIAALRTHHRLISRVFRIMLGSHRSLQESRDQNWLVEFAETLSGAELPPERIWNPTRGSLEAALETINGGLVLSSCRNLERAARHYIQARDQIISYSDALAGGVRDTGTAAHWTIALATIVATVATSGGLVAAGYGLAAVSGAVGLTAGAFGAGVEGATQAGEIHEGLRDEFDVEGIIRRGGEDAVQAFFGTLIGGALAGRFLRMFGTTVAARFTEAELVLLSSYLGQQSQNFFATTGQRLLADFLGGAGAGITITGIRRAFRHIREGSVPTPFELMEEILQEMLTQGVIQVLISFVAGRAFSGTSGRPQATTTTSGPQTPPRAGSDISASSSARPIGSGRVTSSRGGRILGATMSGTAEIPALRGHMPPELMRDILSAEIAPRMGRASITEPPTSISGTAAEAAMLGEATVSAGPPAVFGEAPAPIPPEPIAPVSPPLARASPVTSTAEHVSSSLARTVRVTRGGFRRIRPSSPTVEHRRSSGIRSRSIQSPSLESSRQAMLDQERLTPIEGEEGRALASSEVEIQSGVRRRTTTISGLTAETARPVVRANLEDILSHIDELEAAGALSPGHARRMRMSGGRQLAVHTEVQQSILHPNQPIVVNEPMCFSCFDYFRAEARFRGVTQRVTDTQFVRLFHPNGTLRESPVSGETGGWEFGY